MVHAETICYSVSGIKSRRSVNFQGKSGPSLSNAVTASISNSNGCIRGQGGLFTFCQNAQLPQGFDYRRRSRSMVVAVFDLQRQSKPIRPFS
jgi:hypothetical protein